MIGMCLRYHRLTPVALEYISEISVRGLVLLVSFAITTSNTTLQQTICLPQQHEPIPATSYNDGDYFIANEYKGFC